MDFNAALNIRNAGMSLCLEGTAHAGLPAEQIVNTLNSYVVCKLSAVKQEARRLGLGSS